MEPSNDEFEPQRRGLGGHLMLQDDAVEDTDMPDITREKFPVGIAGNYGKFSCCEL